MNVCTSSATNMLRSLLIVFSAFSSACAADLSSEYAHRAVLDPKGRMSLYWTVNWHKESVSLAVEAATTGWVGFGISSGNGKMAGSDVVIGWVKDSQGYLTVRLLKQFLSRSPSLSKLSSTFICSFLQSAKFAWLFVPHKAMWNIFMHEARIIRLTTF